MLTLYYRNVHEALPEALRILVNEGYKQESRNGPVLEYPMPVATTYSKPQERVGFWPIRDANPFFHFFESLWMLAGRNDVAFPQKFNKSFGQYSDDGVTFHGAYGYRWRQNFHTDQLEYIIDMFKENPLSRRVVLQMWDSIRDLASDSKDLPCNTQCYFWIRNNQLHMTVLNRSNDIIYGCYGANAVHFSFLQEYLAQMIGVGIGNYIQFSNNWHCYTEFEVFKRVEPLTHSDDEWDWGGEDNPYVTGEVSPLNLVTNPNTFDGDLELFLEDPIFCDVANSFLMHIAKPMYKAYEAFKGNHPDRVGLALEQANRILASDWRKACTEWLWRRHNLKGGKSDNS